LNIYGLTEAGPRVTAQRIGECKNKTGSVGKPIRGVSLIIKDQEGRACQSGETGRIFVKSPSLMLGYWNDPESTSGKMIDGWLDTGDLGYGDEDGELFILGRADEVIIRGSHNIDPYRIENVIRKIPGVANCIVFGIPDPIDGQRVVCSIQKEEGVLVEHQKVMACCREYLAPYECPQVICEWAEIPLTPSGKLSRKLAGDCYLNRFSDRR
jgi:long-chain acyl-CoA synthetase